MLIKADRQDHILTLTLNDPARRNAMGNAMREELTAALTAAAGDPQVRVVLLRGAQGSFCAGGDLTAMPPEDPATAARRLRDVGDMIRLLAGFPVPTIAVVEGAAAGMGAGLALACDYVLMAADARLLFPFTRLGLIPDGGLLATLAQRAGASRARQILLEADVLDADACLAAGLADAVHPAADLPAAALAQAEILAGQAPLAVAALKAVLASGTPTLEAALEAEAEHQPKLFFTADFAEGKAAFRERRSPGFTGR